LSRNSCVVQCRFDEEALRYRVQHQGRELLVSLDNLARDFDDLLSLYVEEQSWEEVRGLILFTLEPSDYAEPLPLRTPISDRVDRVPVIVRAPRQTVSFITPTMVDKWQVSLAEVEAAASRNLAAALAAAKEHADVGWHAARLPRDGAADKGSADPGTKPTRGPITSAWLATVRCDP
jgi:hypothetical protein